MSSQQLCFWLWNSYGIGAGNITELGVLCLTVRFCQQLSLRYAESTAIGEWWVGRDLEGSGSWPHRGRPTVLAVAGGTETKHENIRRDGVSANTWMSHLPNLKYMASNAERQAVRQCGESEESRKESQNNVQPGRDSHRPPAACTCREPHMHDRAGWKRKIIHKKLYALAFC
jgi:hypothetical protein